MAAVYRAVHRSSGAHVALKVVRPTRDREGLDAKLRTELRAIARMRHPNIVDVLDVGVMTHAQKIDGRTIDAGQSFLVMELVEGPTLAQYPPLPWLAIKELLLHVLDALAHAHARGVIHRDLKPSNILVDNAARGLLPKISDFGIAAVDPSWTRNAGQSFQGTPAYMAPEQIRGDERDLGPWTDLYAVGCVAYELVQGYPPFLADHYMHVLQAHLHEPPPRLDPGRPVPPGFESWLARLLQKNPLKRFLRAADAAVSLLRLPPLEGDEGPSFAVVSGCGDDTEAHDVFATSVRTLVFADTIAGPELETVASGEYASMAEVRRAPVQAPPMPASWAVSGLPERVAPSLLTLSLFDVRPVPLVGRRGLQNALWSALARVRHSGEAGCVILHGPPGIGKTRLAQWLTATADEMGVAHVLEAYHGREGDDSYGLGGMFARYFRIGGLDPDSAKYRAELLSIAFGRPEAAPITTALVELVVGQQPTESRERIHSDAAIESLCRLTAIATVDRPAVIVLDDLHEAPAAVRYARKLLTEYDIPLLIVATSPDADLPILREISGRVSVTCLEVPELEPEDRVTLIQDCFGMEPDDARVLADYADGNPRLSQELVRGLISQEVLTKTPLGFGIDRGASIEASPEMRRVLRRRLESFLDDWHPLERPALRSWLELGAVLGVEVDQKEWEEAARLSNLTPSPDWLERAAEARLIGTSDQIARFQWRLLRDELVHQAREGGRLESHHRTCLEVVSQGNEAQAYRRALHVHGCAPPERALPQLVDAAEEVLIVHHVKAGRELLDAFIAAAEHLALEPDSLLVGRALAAFSRAHSFGRHGEAAVIMGREAHRIALLHDDPALVARVLWVDVIRKSVAGTHEETMAGARAALAVLPRIEEPTLRAAILSDVSIALGTVGEAAAALETARRALEEAGHVGPMQRWLLQCQAGTAAIEAGALEEAEVWMADLVTLDPGPPLRTDIITKTLEIMLAVATERFRDALRLVEEQRLMRGVRNRWQVHVNNLWKQVAVARTEPWKVDRAALESIGAALGEQSVENALVRQILCVQALRASDRDLAERRLDEALTACRSGKLTYLLAASTQWAAREAAQLGAPRISAELSALAAEQRRRLEEPRPTDLSTA